MINRRALFADETECYKTPYEPEAGDRVTLKLRTMKNDILKAYCIINGMKRTMTKLPAQKGEETFDYYSVSFTCTAKSISYFFKVVDEDDVVCYNRLGCAENSQEEYEFSFVPGQKVPDWAKGTVFYQIFTDRFCNGNPDNDVCDNEYFYTGGHSKKITEWNKFPDELDVRCFYGGDLQGVRSKLDYLQELGVEAIYFNPLFLSPSNHKYDTQDYDYIDPHLAVIEDDLQHEMQHWEHNNGYAPKYIKRVTSKKNLEKSNAYFADLVKEIHSRGMKVVIDGVFNHCGSFNKWLDREGIYLNKEGYEEGAFQSANSPYRNYFKFDKPLEAKSEYEGWWGFPTLPKLNFEKSPELEEYVLSTAEKWVSAPYNVDGWRLDVAADLGHSPKYNHQFWRKFRDRVRAANPEALVFAEHYGDPSAWFKGGEWDSVMNYDAFMEPVTWFLTGMEKHSESFDGNKLWDGKAFFEAMAKNMSRFPRPALDSALNQLSNHDHSRFLTRTNGTVGTLKTMGPHAAAYGVDVRVMQLAVLIQMTWPGSPGIYYADEAGQVGWTDPDSRRTYPWGNEDKALIDYHKGAIELRKRIHCLKMGSVKKLDAGNGYISYGRFDGTDCAAVVINCTDGDLNLFVPVWETGVKSGAEMVCVFDSGLKNDGAKYEVKHGRIFVTIAAKSGCVFTCKLNQSI